MPKYVTLLKFTGSGVKNLRNTTKRAARFQELAEASGEIKILETLWCIGPYDIVHVFEAPNDSAAAGLAMSFNLLGTVRTTTMKGYDREEMEDALEYVITPKDLLAVVD